MLTQNQAIFSPNPENESISTTATHPNTKSIDHYTLNKVISAGTRSISMPRIKFQAAFDPSTKPKSNSIPHKIIKLISTPLRKSSRFDPHSKMESISMPPHKKQEILIYTKKTRTFRSPRKKQAVSDPYIEVKRFSITSTKSSQVWCHDTKIKSVSNPTLKQRQFRSLHWNQVKFDTALKPSQFRPRPKNLVNSDPHNETKSFSTPHNEFESISTTRTKTKLISMLTVKPSEFRPGYKNHTDFNHPHKN